MFIVTPIQPVQKPLNRILLFSYWWQVSGWVSDRNKPLFIFSLSPEQHSTSLTQPSHPRTACSQHLTSFLLQSSNGKRHLALKTQDRRVLVGRLSALELPTGQQPTPAVGTELSLSSINQGWLFLLILWSLPYGGEHKRPICVLRCSSLEMGPALWLAVIRWVGGWSKRD